MREILQINTCLSSVTYHTITGVRWVSMRRHGERNNKVPTGPVCKNAKKNHLKEYNQILSGGFLRDWGEPELWLSTFILYISVIFSHNKQ